jgi:hypothetical protein
MVMTATADVSYTYAVTVSDPDLIRGDVLTVTAPTLPTWLILIAHGDGTAMLTGIPSSALGTNYGHDMATLPVDLKHTQGGGPTCRGHRLPGVGGEGGARCRRPDTQALPCAPGGEGRTKRYRTTLRRPHFVHTQPSTVLTRPLISVSRLRRSHRFHSCRVRKPHLLQ